MSKRVYPLERNWINLFISSGGIYSLILSNRM